MKTQIAMLLLQAISSRPVLSEMETEKPQPKKYSESPATGASRPPQKIEIAFGDDSNVCNIRISNNARQVYQRGDDVPGCVHGQVGERK